MTDSRLKKIATDPRFKRPKKKNVKVKLDPRFASALNSSEFKDSRPKVDKYGRALEQKKNDLQKYYDISEQEEDLDSLDEGIDMAKWARGEIDLESSDDDELEGEAKEEIINLSRSSALTEIEETEEILDTNHVDTCNEPTERIAVVNMDWDNITAKDLYKVFDGFKGQDAKLLSVKIYKSEFGKERLKDEEHKGPPTEIFKPLMDEDDEEEFDKEALRKYQLERLRYFYAIATFNSKQSASKIYKECDGTEYESSASIFDLRYVPKEEEFNEEDVVDSCQALQNDENYKPRSFVTHVLKSSEPKLTWDETDYSRIEKLRKSSFTKEEIENMDLDAFVASASEDEAEGGEADVEKYRALLFGSGGNQNNTDSEQEDMQVTFSAGLTSKAEDLLEERAKKEKEQEMSVFEHERMLKKQKKKTMTKKSKQEETSHEEEEDKSGVATEKELSLLLMDNDTDNLNHFDYDEIVKKSNKNKNKKESTDNFEIDVSDERFNAIFNDSKYAIDPTSSKFKKTKSMEKLLKERNKRKLEEEGDGEENPKTKKQQQQQPLRDDKNKDEWKMIVNKLKHSGKRN